LKKSRDKLMFGPDCQHAIQNAQMHKQQSECITIQHPTKRWFYC